MPAAKKATGAKKASAKTSAMKAAPRKRGNIEIPGGLGRSPLIGRGIDQMPGRRPNVASKVGKAFIQSPRPVRGGGGMAPGRPYGKAIKNAQDWKAIGELATAYKKWLGGLAKQAPKAPVRGGGGMAPGKKAKKR